MLAALFGVQLVFPSTDVRIAFFALYLAIFLGLLIHSPVRRAGLPRPAPNPAAMSHEADVVVVGAGVVGLAAAAALARSGRGVVVLERHGRIACEISSRNSEVIHAGIYYPEGSLKARMCVEGRERLYQHCEDRGVPHRQLGKIIVATCEEEVGVLEELRERGLANGAPGLEMIERRRGARAGSRRSGPRPACSRRAPASSTPTPCVSPRCRGGVPRSADRAADASGRDRADRERLAGDARSRAMAKPRQSPAPPW